MELNPEPKLDMNHPSLEDSTSYLSGRPLLLVFLGLLISVLLVTLDQTIVATALPQIVSHFNALSDVTWVVTACKFLVFPSYITQISPRDTDFLTQGGLVLVFGQILKNYPKKTVFLASIFVFELGSLICALSNSMAQLIAGRAIAGCGAAGIQMSVTTITPEIVPLERRPILFAALGGVIGISAVLGPLLGGTLTDKLSWKWCFWINLPCGAVAVLLVVFLLKIKKRPDLGPVAPAQAWWKRFDWAGGVIVLGFFTSLLLPLQWGGNTKAWNDPTVIALFVVAAVLFGIFLCWERWMGQNAMIPLDVLARRTQIGCALAGFFSYLVMLLGTYYLPLWYQARGHSATHSGLDILPYLIAIVAAAGVCGAIVTKTGQYWWFLFLCPLVAAIGSGLLFTLKADTPQSHLIGFQILCGVGVGGAFQNVLIAVQADYADNEDMIPQATSFVSFCQILGGLVGIAMGGSIFANNLRRNLDVYGDILSPEIKMAILRSVSVIKLLPEPQQTDVVSAYAQSLGPVFLIGVVGAILGSISALCVSNINLHSRNNLSL
ncbi:MFS general substrate transporter [Mycena floridula]|nr:MFS general substrate transporter [Mycena floridula]